jgi:hypothetical protein
MGIQGPGAGGHEPVGSDKLCQAFFFIDLQGSKLTSPLTEARVLMLWLIVLCLVENGMAAFGRPTAVICRSFRRDDRGLGRALMSGKQLVPFRAVNHGKLPFVQVA